LRRRLTNRRHSALPFTHGQPAAWERAAFSFSAICDKNHKRDTRHKK
jgi:hypothetical protein